MAGPNKLTDEGVEIKEIPKLLQMVRIAKLLLQTPSAVQTLFGESLELVAGFMREDGKVGDVVVRTRSFQLKNSVWVDGRVQRIKLISSVEWDSIKKAYIQELKPEKLPGCLVLKPNDPPLALPKRVEFRHMEPTRIG